jgi:hypothetical protein
MMQMKELSRRLHRALSRASREPEALPEAQGRGVNIVYVVIGIACID